MTDRTDNLPDRLTMFRTLPVILLLTALLCCSCRTSTLPKRAVASMFPTVISASQLEQFAPVAATQEDLDSWLDALRVRQDLGQAGLSAADRAVILRGLGRRGYAEIDARSCSLPWQWLYLAGQQDGTLHLVCGFKAMPTKTYLPFPLQGEGVNSWRQGANSRVNIFKAWQSQDATQQVFCVYTPAVPGKISHWEILHVVHIGGN